MELHLVVQFILCCDWQVLEFHICLSFWSIRIILSSFHEILNYLLSCGYDKHFVDDFKQYGSKGQFISCGARNKTTGKVCPTFAWLPGFLKHQHQQRIFHCLDIVQKWAYLSSWLFCSPSYGHLANVKYQWNPVEHKVHLIYIC